MKKLVRDKKAVDTLFNTFIFIILNIIFFVVMFIFVARAGTGTSIYEQTYAKQIALLIDQVKLGTTITMNISELYEIAEKNKYKERPFDINYQENKITIKLASGKGYSYYYFTNLKSESVSIDEQNKLLKINVK